MSEVPEPPAAPRPNSIIGEAGKWLALIGSVIAAGQAGTTWLRGYWQAEAEKQKSAQELALAELKDKSQLAQQYLKVILDKETKPADRAVLYTALGKLDGHPLQKWAQEQYTEYEKDLAKLFEAYKAQSDAAQLRESAEKQVARLSADIEALNSQIEIVRDDPDKRQTLQDQRISKSGELAHVKAALSVAVVKVEETTTVISRSEQGLPVLATANAAVAITSISAKITVSLLASVFPGSALKNIEISVPYLQAAFEEFKVSDKRLAAAIIATIAVETPSFEVYEEPVEHGQQYENRRDLGNTRPGDGVRYRGRGYLEITGRANYERMSLRLGLGSRLLDSPDDARSPEVACRILVAWFMDRQEMLSSALANGDLASARRVVAGSVNQLDTFADVYNKILAQL